MYMRGGKQEYSIRSTPCFYLCTGDLNVYNPGILLITYMFTPHFNPHSHVQHSQAYEGILTSL